MIQRCLEYPSVHFGGRLCWLLIYVLTVVQAAHFRGGYISWQTISPNETNATMVTINIQQTYWWSYQRFPCGAAPIGGPGSLTCLTLNCSNYNSNMANISAPCVSYDIGLGASTAQSVTPVTLRAGSRLVIGFTSSAWLPLVNSMSSTFSLTTLIDLNIRSDTGRINSSPTSSMAALVTVLPNTQQTLRVPMSDIDSDIVRCRWANIANVIDSSTIDECGGICQDVPGAQLYTSSNTDNNCVLVFTTAFIGYYVVALQIEDFMPSAPNSSALSSIPLQFVVQAINTTCNQPNITGELSNGAFITVEVSRTFSTTIIVVAGCNTTNMTRFLTTTAPSNNVTTSPIASVNSMVYSTNFTWTPVADQVGSTQLFCTVAIDANNLQSNQFCLNFIVTPMTTTTTTSTSTSTTSTTTSTSTSTSTSTTSTTTSTSTTSTASFPSIATQLSNNRTVDLKWILGLGIPLMLLAGILGSCIACRCYNSVCWKKLRDRCSRKKDSVSQRYQISEVDRSSISNQQTNEQASRQYRQQYINENSPRPSRYSSYIDSSFPQPPLPTRSISMVTTRTSFLSSYHNPFLPSIETPTSCSPLPNSFDLSHRFDRSSILINKYLEQNAQKISAV